MQNTIRPRRRPRQSLNRHLLIRGSGVLIPHRYNLPVVPVVVFERVGFFAVDGVVANLAHFVTHAEGDAADVFNEEHDEGCGEDVPADDEEGADDLEADLAAVAGDGAAGVGDAEGQAAFFGCPETWMGMLDLFTRARGGRVYLFRCLRQWHLRNECGRRQVCRRLCA